MIPCEHRFRLAHRQPATSPRPPLPSTGSSSGPAINGSGGPKFAKFGLYRDLYQIWDWPAVLNAFLL